jgi:hypothetical protein
MEPQAENNALAEIVRSTEPWVWPATAAIVVGGLIVCWTIMRASSDSPRVAGQTFASQHWIAEHGSFKPENHTDVRAN